MLLNRMKKVKPIVFSVLVVMSLAGFCYLVITNYFKSKFDVKHPSEIIVSSTENYLKSKAPHINISIRINTNHLEQLTEVRNQAIERGVIIQPEDPYVPCKVFVNGDTVKAKIRLKGKMTDHVKGDKWSFRIKTKGNNGVLGMQRFTLQHPGTRGYVYEWIYHQLCKREGIMALRYYYVNLEVNGEDLGVYALEENFSQMLVENNNRPPGPLFRFNPGLYWHARLNAMEKTYIAQEYTTFHNSHVEAFSKKETFENPHLKKSFIEANTLMNSFRWGKKKIDEVFDVSQLAKRYAILDLLGGFHSVDWSDVKFYYNPETKLIEPVAYESFGNRHINELIGNYRFNNLEKEKSDFHDLLFTDSLFFTEYVKHLETLSKESYLSNFLFEIDSGLQEQVAIQYSEFPYKTYSPEVFEFNARMIRNSLNSPKGIHAYLQEVKKDTLIIRAQVIESFPIVITGFASFDSSVQIHHQAIIPGLARNQLPQFYDLKIPWNSTRFPIDTTRGKGLELKWNILGSKTTKSLEVFPYPLYTTEDSLGKFSNLKSATESDHFRVDSIQRVVQLKNKKTVFDSSILIPKNWTWIVDNESQLKFVNQAGIRVEGNVQFYGNTDAPVIIIDSSNCPEIIRIHGSNGKNIVKAVKYISLDSNSTGFKTYNSKVKMLNCSFHSKVTTKSPAVYLQNSIGYLEEITIGTGFAKGIYTNFSFVEVSNSHFSQVKKAIHSSGGNTKVLDSRFIDNSVAVLSENKDFLRINNSFFQDVEIGIHLRNGSTFYGHEILQVRMGLGIKVNTQGNLFGASTAQIQKLRNKDGTLNYQLEPGNTLTIDNKNMEAIWEK